MAQTPIRPGAHSAKAPEPAPASAPASETTASIGADTIQEAVSAAGRIAQEEPVRREVNEPKVSQTVDEISPAKRIEKAMADRPDVEAPEEEFLFMSPFANLTIYVNDGRTEREKDGTSIHRPYQVKFQNGVMRTRNAYLAGLIRKHPRCGTSMFREERNANAFALRSAVGQARANLRSPTHVGPTASSDGLESQFHAQDHELALVEQRLFTI